MEPRLDPKSLVSLRNGHPLLQQLFTAVSNKTNIIILDATRGRAAQEEAFRKGNSRAHFGESAHNYVPSIAFDVVPDHDPDLAKRVIRWDHVPSFLSLSRIVLATAKELVIPITWGGDWDGDGDRTDQKLHDLPHYELKPWREWSKKSKLVGV